MDQQSVDDLERALLDVLVRPVDRVAGLEPDHGLPATLGELGPRLGRRQPVPREVVMRGERQHLEIARETVVARVVDGLHPRVFGLVGAIDGDGFLLLVALEGAAHPQHRDRAPRPRRATTPRAAAAELVGLRLVDAQHDRDRPREPVRGASSRAPSGSRPHPGSRSAGSTHRRPASRGRRAHARSARASGGWRPRWRGRRPHRRSRAGRPGCRRWARWVGLGHLRIDSFG